MYAGAAGGITGASLGIGFLKWLKELLKLHLDRPLVLVLNNYYKIRPHNLKVICVPLRSATCSRNPETLVKAM